MGETASGKSALAEAIAAELGGQLINADAFQVYRGLDIGTSKPVDRARYELLDLKNPDEPFGAGEWVQLAANSVRRAVASGRSAILVGGTGFYIRALLEGYDAMSPPGDPARREELNALFQAEGLEPLLNLLESRSQELFGQVDRKNPARVIRAIERSENPSTSAPPELPAVPRLKLAIRRPVDVLDARIVRRTQEMFTAGWVKEVECLRASGYEVSAPGLRAIGYRTIWDHLEHRLDLAEAIATTIATTRRYAKRQRTWLRTEPKLVTLDAKPLPELLGDAMSAIRSRSVGGNEIG